MERLPGNQIYNIGERLYYGSSPTSTDYDSQFLGSGVPLVVDVGSYQCQVGWATENSPRLHFDTLVSKYRDRKLNSNILLVGNDIYADVTARSNSKSPFDGNIISNFETMECIMDYIFVKLGISTDRVEHPILMTEPVCNPHHSRKQMSELLFECYQAPSVCYGIDALFSFHANELSFDKGGIVLSLGHSTTHILPVYNGRGVLEHAKRISYGGVTSTDFMLRLMQLKYPTFPTKMTHAQAQHLVQNYTYVAEDYFEELKEFIKQESFSERDCVIQFPYVAPATEKTEEEVARAEERRQEQSRRLKEQAEKLRMKKLKEKEEELEYYAQLRESKSMSRKSEFLARLREDRINDENELDDIIKKIEKAIQRARNRLLGIDEVEIKEEPTFPLVDTPDSQLNEAERKEKRKQLAAKSLHESRQRQREAKELARKQQEEEERLERERRDKDLTGWLNNVKTNYANQLEKVKILRRRKEQLADRRSHASQLRMQSIASLAGDTLPQKRRRRGQDEDTFGMDDNDWEIYKEISREEDSWEEEEELTTLRELEAKLLQYDSTFLLEHTFDAQNSVQNSLVFMFTHGVWPPYDPDDVSQLHQLHVNIERIRVPEAMFQPSIIGLDQAGLVETVSNVVSRFKEEEMKTMVQSIFLTGGHTQIPGLSKRLEVSLRSALPAGAALRIIPAKDPVVDAWQGAALWAKTPEFKQYVVTIQDYQEYGGEYLKEHRFGNVYRK